MRFSLVSCALLSVALAASPLLGKDDVIQSIQHVIDTQPEVFTVPVIAPGKPVGPCSSPLVRDIHICVYFNLIML